jgi:release factor glutamine methyltransferase
LKEKKFGDIYIKGKEILKKQKIQSYESDNINIFQNCFGIKRHDLVFVREKIAPFESAQKYFEMIKKRINGEPIQYLIGNWNFMGHDLKVGEGVLIPRDDTEVLILESVKLISKINKPIVFDLCSGSGAIAIVLDSLINNPDMKITAIEYSKEAYSYLEYNVKKHKKNIQCLNMNIFECHNLFADNSIDAIISNPPYICEEDVNSLQREVKFEPEIALNGGKDGLDFYRIILNKWVKKLKKGGFLGIEIGWGQLGSILDMFKICGLRDIISFKDINGVDRAVFAVK